MTTPRRIGNSSIPLIARANKLAEYVQYVDINKDGWLDRIFIAQGYVKGNNADMLMVAEANLI